MTFDKIINDGRLWAVRYNHDKENALQKVLSQWSDAGWLADFFTQNFEDLISYFRITNIEDAIYQTMEDRDELACIIMDISPDANLDQFFRPLENNRTQEMMLGREKGRLQHRSWLRLYAICRYTGHQKDDPQCIPAHTWMRRHDMRPACYAALR